MWFFNNAVLSFLGLVLIETTDLLNLFIGRDTILHTTSCALTSLYVRNAEPTSFNFMITLEWNQFSLGRETRKHITNGIDF